MVGHPKIIRRDLNIGWSFSRQVAAAAAARRHVHPERFVRPPPITSPGTVLVNRDHT